MFSLLRESLKPDTHTGIDRLTNREEQTCRLGNHLKRLWFGASQSCLNRCSMPVIAKQARKVILVIPHVRGQIVEIPHRNE